MTGSGKEQPISRDVVLDLRLTRAGMGLQQHERGIHSVNGRAGVPAGYYIAGSGSQHGL